MLDDQIPSYNFSYLESCIYGFFNKQFLLFYFFSETNINNHTNLAKIACQKNNFEIIHILYKLNYNFEYIFNENCKAINVAAVNNSKECLNKLIEYGSDINNRDNDGHTPIFGTALYGNLDCLNILYEVDQLF